MHITLINDMSLHLKYLVSIREILKPNELFDLCCTCFFDWIFKQQLCNINQIILQVFQMFSKRSIFNRFLLKCVVVIFNLNINYIIQENSSSEILFSIYECFSEAV